MAKLPDMPSVPQQKMTESSLDVDRSKPSLSKSIGSSTLNSTVNSVDRDLTRISSVVMGKDVGGSYDSGISKNDYSSTDSNLPERFDSSSYQSKNLQTKPIPITFKPGRGVNPELDDVRLEIFRIVNSVQSNAFKGLDEVAKRVDTQADRIVKFQKALANTNRVVNALSKDVRGLRKKVDSLSKEDPLAWFNDKKNDTIQEESSGGLSASSVGAFKGVKDTYSSLKAGKGAVSAAKGGADAFKMGAKIGKVAGPISGLLSGGIKYAETGNLGESVAVGAGSGLGTVGGAWAGAIVGQTLIPIPGVGAVIGAAVGGFLGGSAGESAGQGAYDFFNKKKDSNALTEDARKESEVTMRTISLEARESLSLKSLFETKISAKNLSINASELNFDVSSVIMSSMAKEAFVKAIGSRSVSSGSEGSGSQTKQNNDLIYKNDVQKLGQDKADRLADLRENPIMGSSRFLLGRLTGKSDEEIAQSAGEAIGTRSSASRSPSEARRSPSGSSQGSGTNVVNDTLDSSAGGGLGALIAKGESGKRGYNAYNTGYANQPSAHIDFSQMTIGEVMNKQSNRELFAVGKYQIIPSTMAGAVKALNLDPNQKLTPEVQEHIFRNHLLTTKRPQIEAYIKGTGDREKAILASSQEWAAIANPRTGRSYYSGTAGNAASITAESVGRELDIQKKKYQDLKALGKSDEEAWNASFGAIESKESKSSQRDASKPDRENDDQLRVKGGMKGQAFAGGETHEGVMTLAKNIQNDNSIGLKYFSAFNDRYHSGTNSKHAHGLATDLTLSDSRTAPDVVKSLRKKFADQGIDATVIDEYNNPSSRATGGHIHIQFNSRADADRYHRLNPTIDKKTKVDDTSQSNSNDQNQLAKDAGIDSINTKNDTSQDLSQSQLAKDAGIDAIKVSDKSKEQTDRDLTQSQLAKDAGIDAIKVSDIPPVQDLSIASTQKQEESKPTIADAKIINNEDLDNAIPKIKPAEQPTSESISSESKRNEPERENKTRGSSNSDTEETNRSVSDPRSSIGDKGPEPGSDGYGAQKQNPDGVSGLCMV